MNETIAIKNPFLVIPLGSVIGRTMVFLTRKDVDLVFDLPAVQEVKHLHEDKSVEDQREMTRWTEILTDINI